MSTFGESGPDSSAAPTTSISIDILLDAVPMAITDINEIMGKIRSQIDADFLGITPMHGSTAPGREYPGTTGKHSHRRDHQVSRASRHVSPAGNVKYLLTLRG
jgi:hypothetical protein